MPSDKGKGNASRHGSRGTQSGRYISSYEAALRQGDDLREQERGGNEKQAVRPDVKAVLGEPVLLQYRKAPPRPVKSAADKQAAAEAEAAAEAARREAARKAEEAAAEAAAKAERMREQEKKEQKVRLKISDWISLRIGKIDVPFLILLTVLVVFGLMMLYSSSYTTGYYKHNGDPFFFIKKQSLYVIAGFVIMFMVSAVPYQRLQKLWVPIMALSLVCLALVLVIGTNHNTEATRWLDLGPVSFQPSEIAKAAVVMCFSSLAVRFRDRMKKFSTLLVFFAIMGVVAFLMLKEPHLSATIIVVATAFVILFEGGARIWQLLAVGGSGIAGAVYLVWFVGYQKDRIETWLDPWADRLGNGYQVIQSLYAVCSGGFWGLGLGQSRQKQMYLPESYNDFIFAILSEELGFLGATIVIALFAALVIRGFIIALRSKDTYGTFLVSGFMAQIALQVFFNIGVVTGLMPVTGAALPFFSYGGTSLLLLFAEMGVVLSVSRQMKGRQEPPENT